MQRQQELHQTKKFHLPVFLKYSIECRQSSFTCGIHDQRGLRFSLLNGVFMWICHQVTFQEIVSEPQTPFCPASYLYFTAKFILRNETSTAFVSETGRFPIVKFGQIRCFNLKLERIKKSKQSEKVTLASRNINHEANDFNLLKFPELYAATRAISENKHDDYPFIILDPVPLPKHKTI